VVSGKVSRPDDRASVGIEAMQMSMPTQSVEPAPLEYRRGIRTSLLTRSEGRFRWCYRVSVGPQGSAIGDIKAMDTSVTGGTIELEVDDENSVPDHHRTRESKSDRRLPPNPQRPRFHDSPEGRTGPEIVPVGAEPLRPVGGLSRSSRRHASQEGQQQPEPDLPEPKTTCVTSDRGSGNRGYRGP